MGLLSISGNLESIRKEWNNAMQPVGSFSDSTSICNALWPHAFLICPHPVPGTQKVLSKCVKLNCESGFHTQLAPIQYFLETQVSEVSRLRPEGSDRMPSLKDVSFWYNGPDGAGGAIQAWCPKPRTGPVLSSSCQKCLPQNFPRAPLGLAVSSGWGPLSLGLGHQ